MFRITKIIIFGLLCVLHYRSPVEAIPPDTSLFHIQPPTGTAISLVPIAMATSDTGLPCAEGGKDFRFSGSYEPLQGNLYNSLDEVQPAPPDMRRPVPPVKPKVRPGEYLDDCGYLKFRDTKSQSEMNTDA